MTSHSCAQGRLESVKTRPQCPGPALPLLPAPFLHPSEAISQMISMSILKRNAEKGTALAWPLRSHQLPSWDWGGGSHPWQNFAWAPQLKGTGWDPLDPQGCRGERQAAGFASRRLFHVGSSPRLSKSSLSGWTSFTLFPHFFPGVYAAHA